MPGSKPWVGGSEVALDARDGAVPALRFGPYRIEEVLGGGSAAVVYLGRRVLAREPNECFAVKRFLPEVSESPSFTETFHRAAALGEKLDHPNIARVVDFGEQDGAVLLVTEWVDGTSCRRVLSAVAKQQEQLPMAATLYVACEVLDALAYAHDLQGVNGSPLGIVHRNVSPGNILFGAMGEVKLADFGVAATSRSAPSSGRLFEGKIGYMSPEQVHGGGVDGRSDLFSLGLVVFEMLTGVPFFCGANDREILGRMHEGLLSPLTDERAKALPLELRLVLTTALAAERRERFTDAREFARAIRTFARHVSMAIERRDLLGELRRLGIWPRRSGTHTAVRATKSAKMGPE